MVHESTFEVARKRYKRAQVEKFKESEKEQKKLTDPEDLESESPGEIPMESHGHLLKQQTVKEAKKTIELRENLRDILKQTQATEISDKESKEEEFRPITKLLEKVEKAVIQTDEALSRKLELLPKLKPKQLKFDSSEEPKPLPTTPEAEDVEEKSIKAILGAPGKNFGPLPRKYLPFPDNKFGIWFDDENFYIGNKENKILIDGNDLIVNDQRYKGSHGLWRLLTNPNRKKMSQETYDTWWTSRENFSEKDLASYKEILITTHSMYQGNNPSTKKPKSSMSKKMKRFGIQILERD